MRGRAVDEQGEYRYATNEYHEGIVVEMMGDWLSMNKGNVDNATN